MTLEKILPTVNIALAIGACVCYAWIGDYRRAVYWGAAAMLTASITF